MRVGSLFSGIGGIELGLERAGSFRTAWFVEWNPYCQEVLKKNWEGVPVYGDVTAIAWETMPAVDVLTGGFPCQPHSIAGKRKASGDERDLWPECRRAIAALKPRVCIFENVPGLLTSEKGEFFKRVIDDFYNLGYTPRVYRLSARDVGAKHLRKRIFIVAYSDSHGAVEQGQDHMDEERHATSPLQERENKQSGIECPSDDVPDASSEGLEGQQQSIREQTAYAVDGFHNWWAVEPDVGRVADGVPFRVDRIKSLGNAVVPQCAQVIGEIVKAEMSK